MKKQKTLKKRYVMAALSATRTGQRPLAKSVELPSPIPDYLSKAVSAKKEYERVLGKLQERADAIEPKTSEWKEWAVAQVKDLKEYPAALQAFEKAKEAYKAAVAAKTSPLPEDPIKPLKPQDLLLDEEQRTTKEEKVRRAVLKVLTAQENAKRIQTRLSCDIAFMKGRSLPTYGQVVDYTEVDAAQKELEALLVVVDKLVAIFSRTVPLFLSYGTNTIHVLQTGEQVGAWAWARGTDLYGLNTLKESTAAIDTDSSAATTTK